MAHRNDPDLRGIYEAVHHVHLAGDLRQFAVALLAVDGLPGEVHGNDVHAQGVLDETGNTDRGAGRIV